MQSISKGESGRGEKHTPECGSSQNVRCPQIRVVSFYGLDNFIGEWVEELFSFGEGAEISWNTAHFLTFDGEPQNCYDSCVYVV